MKTQDSRPVTELSQDEFAEYFPQLPPPKPTYPDWEFCVLHDLWYISRCYLCLGDAIRTVERLESFDYNCWWHDSWNQLEPEELLQRARRNMRTELCWCLISEKLLHHYFMPDFAPNS